MTVSSTTNRKSFAGNGVTTSFSTSPVTFFDTSDMTLAVADDLTGVITPLTENTHYTGTGGDGSTGTFDLSAGSSPYGAPATGTTLIAVRVLPVTQTVDLVNNDINDAEVMEGALDKLTMLVQQQLDTADRSVRLATGDSSDGDDMILPSIPDRASRLLGFDSGGVVTTYDPASTLGTSDNITYTPAGTAAVVTTVQERLRQSVSVFDFIPTALHAGIVDGTNATSLKAYIVAAYAAFKHVRFPAGTYAMGNVSAGETMVTIDGAGGSASLLTEGIAKFTCTTTDSTIPFFFDVKDVKGFHVGDVKFQDAGYDDTVDWKGACAIRLLSQTSKPIYDTTIDSIHCEDMVVAVSCQGTTAAGSRVEGINIGLMYCDHCYYGFNAQNTGDGVKIGMIVSSEIKRSYFVYGVSRHDVSIFSKEQQSSSGDVQIAYDKASSLDTRDIYVRYCGRKTSGTTGTAIGLEFIGADGGAKTISNIRFDVDIESSITSGSPILFRDYNAAGVENTGATNNIFDRIAINGRIVAASVATNLVNIACQPATRGQLHLGAGILRSTINANVNTYFDHSDSALFNLTPTGWSDSTAISCGYSIQGNTVTLTIGSKTGTSNATGKSYATLPAYLRPGTNVFVPVGCTDNGGARVWGLANVATSGTISIFPTPAAGNWTASGTATIDAFQCTYNLRP